MCINIQIACGLLELGNNNCFSTSALGLLHMVFHGQMNAFWSSTTKLLHLSKICFLHLINGGDNIPMFLFYELYAIIYAELIKQMPISFIQQVFIECYMIGILLRA